MSSSLFFTEKQLSSLDLSKIPFHIAIAPDGNRRWAFKQQYETEFGYQAGADVITEITKAAKEIGVKVLTFYIFSTENWSRPQEEIEI